MNRMRLLGAGVVVSMMLTMLTGCISEPLAAPVPPMDTRVTIAPNIGSSVYVTDVRCAKTKGSDFYTMQANVVNNTYSEKIVQWKVIWLDSNGIEIESLTSTWNSIALQPFEFKGLASTAPSLDAVDMRFYLRKMP